MGEMINVIFEVTFLPKKKLYPQICEVMSTRKTNIRVVENKNDLEDITITNKEGLMRCGFSDRGLCHKINRHAE